MRMTISIPDNLRGRMDKVEPAPNWSGIAAKAFTGVVESFEIEYMAERLQRTTSARVSIAEEAGELWAMESATPEELEAAEGAFDAGIAALRGQPPAPLNLLQSRVTHEENESAEEITEWLTSNTGMSETDMMNPDLVRAFLTGAVGRYRTLKSHS